VITEQAEDALLEFLSKLKQGVWPVRRSVEGHLRQAAWRNVRDQVQAATRRRANEARFAREQIQLRQSHDDDSSSHFERVLALAHDKAETEALLRWVEGDSAFRIAEALALSHLPVAEQVRALKRFKDRIKKRARRDN
jgi:hypothetical protein